MARTYEVWSCDDYDGSERLLGQYDRWQPAFETARAHNDLEDEADGASAWIKVGDAWFSPETIEMDLRSL